MPVVHQMWHRVRSLFQPRMRKCPVSGVSGLRLQNLGAVAVTQQVSLSRDTFNLVYSAKADLVYLDPLPEEQDFELMYSAVQFDSDEYSDPARIESMMDYYSKCIERHFQLDLHQSQSSEPFKMLEVGAGMSWVSRALKSIEPEARTQAQDISPECLEKCEWVDDYFHGTIEALNQQKPTSYNAISLTHVIEHVPDPVKTLKTLASMLAINGVILLTAPSRPKGWMPESGLQLWLDYSYLHVPAHITYFSETALRMAAEKAGLVLKHWDGSHDDHQAFEATLVKI